MNFTRVSVINLKVLLFKNNVFYDFYLFILSEIFYLYEKATDNFKTFL